MTDDKPTYRIMDFAAGERPRERLANLEAQSLSNTELIAILLRIGVTGENAIQVGQRLLHNFSGLTSLHRASIEEVETEHGIGPTKAAQIKAAIELGRRLMIESPADRHRSTVRGMPRLWCSTR